MNIYRSISHAAVQLASACAFNAVLVVALAAVRGQGAAALTYVVVVLGLVAAVGVFGLVTYGESWAEGRRGVGGPAS